MDVVRAADSDGHSVGLHIPTGPVVRDRATIIGWLESQGDIDIWLAPEMTTHDSPPAFNSVTDWDAIKVREGDKTDYPGLFRRCLGDKDIAILALGPTQRPDYCSCRRIRSLFPETTIYSLRQDDRDDLRSP